MFHRYMCYILKTHELLSQVLSVTCVMIFASSVILQLSFVSHYKYYQGKNQSVSSRVALVTFKLFPWPLFWNALKNANSGLASSKADICFTHELKLVTLCFCSSLARNHLYFGRIAFSIFFSADKRGTGEFVVNYDQRFYRMTAMRMYDAISIHCFLQFLQRLQQHYIFFSWYVMYNKTIYDVLVVWCQRLNLMVRVIIIFSCLVLQFSERWPVLVLQRNLTGFSWQSSHSR